MWHVTGVLLCEAKQQVLIESLLSGVGFSVTEKVARAVVSGSRPWFLVGSLCIQLLSSATGFQ